MSTSLNVATATRVMHLMDESGDTSLGWDPEDDEWVLPMIRRKMEAGPGPGGERHVSNPLREVLVQRVEELRETRHVIIKDDESRDLFEHGQIGIADTGDTDLEVERRATTAEEVVENETVAHRPLRGG